MQVDTLLTRNIAHTNLCGQNIEKNTWLNNKDSTTVLKSKRVLLLSSNPDFLFQRFRLQVVLKMDTCSNPRRALKSAQEQEDMWWHRNKRGRVRSAAETVEQRSEGLRKWRERDRARRTAQTASERQATSQQRSIHERERMAAESLEEKDYSRKVPAWTWKNGSWNLPGEKDDYSGRAPTSTNSWQLKPLKREKWGYSRWVIDWQLKPLRREKRGYSRWERLTAESTEKETIVKFPLSMQQPSISACLHEWRHSYKKHLGGIAGAWTSTVWGQTVVQTNQLGYFQNADGGQCPSGYFTV